MRRHVDMGAMRWRFAIVAIVVFAVVAVSSAVASAAEPWWRLELGARPTVVPMSTGDSKQELATGTGFLIAAVEVEGVPVACVTSEFIEMIDRAVAESKCKSSEVDDGASQLEASLNKYFGAGVVEVTGKAGGPAMVAGGEPMIVVARGRGLAPIELNVVLGASEGVSSRVLSEGGSDKIVLQAFNLGDAPVDGASSPVTLVDKLPAGLRATGMAGATGRVFFAEEGSASLPVELEPETKPGEKPPGSGRLKCSVASVSCTYTGTLEPYERLEVVIWVTRTGADGEEGNEAEVSGGGAASASRSSQVKLGEGPVPFGVESYESEPEEEGGAPATQAGSHPFQLTTMLRLNETGEVPYQAQQPRDITVELPAGLVGDAQATEKCSYAVFSRREVSFLNKCPAESAVGVATASVVEGQPEAQGQLPGAAFDSPTVPVFNLTPASGEPARFGFIAEGVPVVLDTYLRSGHGYGVTVTVQNLTESASALSSMVTLWGMPGAAVHDRSRGWACFRNESFEVEQEGCGPSVGSQKPLLTMPSSCEEPLQMPVTLQAWGAGALPLEAFPSEYNGVVDGCNQEGFEPGLQVSSSSSSAYSPTELTVHLKVPQQTSETAGGISEADVRNTKVTLPAGLQLNPAAAGGLGACAEQTAVGVPVAIGYVGKEESGQLEFQEESQGERDGEEAHRYACPEDSKIGTVKIKTPLLEEDLTGAVYQAAQEANPFGSLLALYVIAEAPQAGVRVRLAGKVEVLPSGQLISTFDQTPQLPFEEFELNFFGEGKSPLATSGCGSYTTTSSIESWAGGAPVGPFSAFTVNNGCGDYGFTPSFNAGTAENQAGAFSPFVMKLSRKDGEQMLSTVDMTMPPGLAGMLSTVTLCEEAQANAGTCPAASKIGYVRVSAGVGGEPIVLPEAGKPEDPVYLTKSYKGAPFGLSIVVPAEAGPFNLDEGGHPVVVRAKVNVDPHTAQVSVQSDPIPTELQNIPLQVRSSEIVVNRAGFIFNPTNCSALELTGTIGSSEGASEAVKNRFQAANCATLPFKPGFKVGTHAKHTKRFGAYLHVGVTSGHGQANIRSVFVKLPKVLPSRVETLKAACTEKQFAKNPAGCPAGSRVGTAVAHTPVLPVPLTGPAIFVSHGGAAFPDLDVVLEGDGVTIDLTGNTNIVKGITSSDFKSVPDVPVSSFELTLPESSHSALAATANLCTEMVTKRVKTKVQGKVVYRKRRVKTARKLMMPTTITGQNGAVVEQDTKIAVTGCKARTKAGKRGQKKKKKRH